MTDRLIPHLWEKSGKTAIENDAKQFNALRQVNRASYVMFRPCSYSPLPMKGCIKWVKRHDRDCYDCVARTDGDLLAILVARSRQTHEDEDGGVDSETLIDLIKNADLRATAENIVKVTRVRRGMTKWEFKADELNGINPDSSVEPMEEGLTAADVYQVECSSIGNLPRAWIWKVKHVKVPQDLKHIGEKAFAGCMSLTTVDLPQELTHIGREAFTMCEGLITVDLPQRLSRMEFNAFSKCKRLTAVYIRQGLSCIDEGAFASCSGLTTVQLPEGLREIKSGAFRVCISLTTVRFPQSLKKIDNAAFASCVKLTTVYFAQGLQHIGDEAFAGSKRLTTVSIHQGVTHIGDRAFWLCPSLTTADLPRGLTNIGTQVFAGCKSLKYVRVHDRSVQQWSSLLGVDESKIHLKRHQEELHLDESRKKRRTAERHVDLEFLNGTVR